MLREAASGIAATSFAEQFAQLKKEEQPGKDATDTEMETLRAVAERRLRVPPRGEAADLTMDVNRAIASLR